MCQALFFDPWIRKIPWGRAWQPIPVVVILAWRIPWTEEPGRAMHRVGHDWSDLARMHARTVKLLYVYYNSVLLMVFLSPFYGWGNWDPEQLCHLSRIFGYFLREGVLRFQFLWPLHYEISFLLILFSVNTMPE